MVVSLYYDPKGESHQTEILVVMWAMTAVAMGFVIARLGVRQRILKYVGVDDWLIAASMVFGVIFTIAATVSVSYGYGKHSADLTPYHLEKALLWNMISFVFGLISFALPKVAVAALLHRLLEPTKLQRLMIWTLAGLMIAIALVNILLYVTTCNPPQALWKRLMVYRGEATCRDIHVLIGYVTFNAAFSAFVDLFYAVLPAIVLMRLQMSLRKKIALSVGLGLGSVAAATAMIKCVTIKGFVHQMDLTYATAPLLLWTSVEANVVVIAACMPTLQRVLENILKKLKPTTFKKGPPKPSMHSQSKDFFDNHSRVLANAKHHKSGATSIGGSQESILGSEPIRKLDLEGGIHIKQDFTVKREKRDDFNFEMI